MSIQQEFNLQVVLSIHLHPHTTVIWETFFHRYSELGFLSLGSTLKYSFSLFAVTLQPDLTRVEKLK